MLTVSLATILVRSFDKVFNVQIPHIAVVEKFEPIPRIRIKSKEKQRKSQWSMVSGQRSVVNGSKTLDDPCLPTIASRTK